MKLLKPFWIFLGVLSLGLGCAGIPLPVLPTTPFLLLAAFCFTKGSEKIDIWFRNSKIYKNHLESFVVNKAMTLKTKLCILLPASLMLVGAFIGMSHKDTTATRIGRCIVVLMIILKYVYFFIKIKTLPLEKEKIPVQEGNHE